MLQIKPLNTEIRTLKGQLTRSTGKEKTNMAKLLEAKESVKRMMEKVKELEEAMKEKDEETERANSQSTRLDLQLQKAKERSLNSETQVQILEEQVEGMQVQLNVLRAQKAASKTASVPMTPHHAVKQAPLDPFNTPQHQPPFAGGMQHTPYHCSHQPQMMPSPSTGGHTQVNILQMQCGFVMLTGCD